MSFVYPYFLWALGALGIPVIIHLFSFRRYKTVYFPNVLFLQEVKKESDSRTRIKHWLILIARLLTLTAIVLAFAQPIFKTGNESLRKGKKAISIYIDNSFSMLATENDIPLLEIAKAKGREIIDAYAPDDDFQILSNNLDGIQQRLVNRDQAKLIIDDIKVSPQWRTLNEIIAFQNQYLTQADAPNRVSYIISDFQKVFTNGGVVKQDTTISRQLIRLQSSHINNVSIDSCWLEKPLQLKGENVKLFVKITNYSSEPIKDGRLTLEQNGQTKAISTYQVASNSSVIDTLNFSNTEPGWQAYSVRIQDYPISYDDIYYIAFETVDKLPILIINENKSNIYLSTLFNQAQRFELTQLQSSNLQYDDLSKYRLIVLNAPNEITGGLQEALQTAVSQGSNLMLVPAPNVDKTSYDNFLAVFLKGRIASWINTDWQTDKFNLQHYLLKDIFESLPKNIAMPQGKGYYTLNLQPNTIAQSVFTSLSGQPLLLSAPFQKGQFFFSTIPLDKDYNNFPMNALFAPIIFKMCLPQTFTESLSYKVGSTDIIHVPVVSGAKESLLKLKKENEEILPQQRVLGRETQLMTTQLLNAGIYDVTDGTTIYKKVALNFNRKESNTDCLSDEELKQLAISQGAQWIDASARMNLTQRITENAHGIPLWKYCVIFAIVFLVIEILLLKLFK